MLKKILLTTIGATILVGSGWFYAAQRFEEESFVLLKNLESYNPYLKYEKAEIKKYCFEICLTDIKAGYIPTHENHDSLPHMHFTMDGEMVLFYNPINKVLTINSEDVEKSSFKFGETVKAFKHGKSSHPFINKIRFKHHPLLTKMDWSEFIKNITGFEAQGKEVKYYDADTEKLLLSADESSSKVNFSYPLNETDPYELDSQINYENLILTEDFVKFIADIIKTEGVGLETVLLKNPNSGKITFKGTTPKAEIEAFVKEVVNGDIKSKLPLFPSINIDLNTHLKDATATSKTTANVDYLQHAKTLKFNYDMGASFTPVYAKLWVEILKEAFKQDSKETGEPMVLNDASIEKIFPNFADLSPLKMAAIGDIEFKDAIKVNDLHLNIAVNECEATLTGKFNLPEGNAVLELKDYPQLFAALQSYIQKLINADSDVRTDLDKLGMTKEALQHVHDAYLVNGQEFARMIGKSVEGVAKPTLMFEGKLNLATGENTINGKPLFEILMMFMNGTASK